MKIPERLQPLIHDHIIDDVIGQLQSGKEADVFLVVCRGETRCAKVYKEANSRSFRQRTQYTEGRSVQNSRKSRAMNRKSKFGKQEAELEWHNTEVEALAALEKAGIRVPKTYDYHEGVLILEMIVDRQGEPAPRLGDVELTPERARSYHLGLIRESVKMLCAGYVHGDFSEYNILVSGSGLVIIDLPQAVQATSSTAFSIFKRDLTQLAKFFSAWAPEIGKTQHADEIWEIYRKGKLRPKTKLTGIFVDKRKKANVKEVLEEIEAAREEEMEKRGLSEPRDDGERWRKR